MAKIVVNRTPGAEYDQVLGIHIAAPFAGKIEIVYPIALQYLFKSICVCLCLSVGEIIQGFGVAIKKGLTYHDLISTVGTHPTNAEELVQATVSKSSGEPVEKGNC